MFYGSLTTHPPIGVCCVVSFSRDGVIRRPNQEVPAGT